MHSLESDKTPFSMAYHIIKQSSECTTAIIEEYCPDLKEICDDLCSYTDSRLEFGRADISKAAYLLTRQGRNEYRNKKITRNENVEIRLLNKYVPPPPTDGEVINAPKRYKEFHFTLETIDIEFFDKIKKVIEQEDKIKNPSKCNLKMKTNMMNMMTTII